MKVERDKGIEPSPRPWQGRVLPLYESRSIAIAATPVEFIPRRRHPDKASNEASCARIKWDTTAATTARARETLVPASLIHFEDASSFHDRRFLLARGKALGAIAIDIHSGKLLAIIVIHGYLPVAVFASAIPLHAVRLLCPSLFQVNGPQTSELSQFSIVRASG
jgi:hypothetical protein